MTSDCWIVEGDGCSLDLAKCFEAEWTATSQPFVVADLETTGTHPDFGEILEFAAILVEASGEITAEFSVLVSITQPVPDFIKEETGITQAEVDLEGRPLAEALKAFLTFVGSRPVFTHHAPFDEAFLKKAGKQTQQSFDNPVHDTLDIAVLTWPTSGSRNIDALAEYVGAPKTGQRALDNAKATLTVLLAAREQARLEAD